MLSFTLTENTEKEKDRVAKKGVLVKGKSGSTPHGHP